MLSAHWRGSLENSNADGKTATRKRPTWLPATFSSLRHRNYRLFFFGQLISVTGMWMQWAAQSWLVFDIARREDVLGIVRSVSTLPLAVLSLFGGVLADRFRRKSILITTQSMAVVPPCILAWLILTGSVEIWHIALLISLSGIVTAFDMPTRQAFVLEMVNRKDLMNAVSLNSALFNSARIFGPLVAGVVIAWVGIGYCFMFNGLSYIAVVFALLLIRVPVHAPRPPGESVKRRLAAGLRYVRSDWRLMGIFGLVGIAGVFGFSYMVLMPAFARIVFKTEALGYTGLLAFNGIGALAGALFIATVGGKVKNKRHLLFIGILIFCLAITAFSLTTSLAIALTSLVFAGVGMTMLFTTAMTLVQMIAPEKLRGRVMGIYSFVFMGSIPVGSLAAGFAAQHIGRALTVQIGALVCAVTALAASVIGRRVKAPEMLPEPPETSGVQIPY
jgi:MFS family permease